VEAGNKEVVFVYILRLIKIFLEDRLEREYLDFHYNNTLMQTKYLLHQAEDWVTFPGRRIEDRSREILAS